MDQERQKGFPKTQMLIENVERKQTEKNGEGDADDAGCPKQQIS
jgi:hypothetical protein